VRYLILSDIHANWEALQAVLADAEGRHDQIVCCGDVVGYGGDPNRATEWIRQSVEHVVRGNHDKAATGSEDIEWFNPVAKRATLWTQGVLLEANSNYLRNLPKGPLQLDGFQLVHGSPLDEDDYLVSPGQAAQLFGYIARLTFFGHSHLQGGFLVHRDGVRPIEKVPADRSAIELTLPEGYACLINPGSVGQPRDGDPRAGYVIYETEEQVISYCRVPYDIAGAQQKIIDAGLPDVLARRLSLGA
jgi:predicted phosphodiesterase